MRVLTNGSFHAVQLCIHIHEALFPCCAVRGTGGCSIAGPRRKIMTRKTVNKCRSRINAHLCKAVCFELFFPGHLTEYVFGIISVVYSHLFFRNSPLSSLTQTQSGDCRRSTKQHHYPTMLCEVFPRPKCHRVQRQCFSHKWRRTYFLVFNLNACKLEW